MRKAGVGLLHVSAPQSSVSQWQFHLCAVTTLELFWTSWKNVPETLKEYAVLNGTSKRKRAAPVPSAAKAKSSTLAATTNPIFECVLVRSHASVSIESPENVRTDWKPSGLILDIQLPLKGARHNFSRSGTLAAHFARPATGGGVVYRSWSSKTVSILGSTLRHAARVRSMLPLTEDQRVLCRDATLRRMRIRSLTVCNNTWLALLHSSNNVVGPLYVLRSCAQHFTSF